MRNPFEFGRELAADELVDRQDELATLREALLSGGKVFLIGPRRFGKTSLLRSAAEQVEREGAVVLRYDAQAFPTLEQLAARIAADTAQRLTSTLEKAGTAIREFFASVRPAATYEATENKWSLTLAGTPGRETGPSLLADVLDGVERAAIATGRTVAVVIDEFQEVVEDGGEEAEEQIRAAIQRHRQVGYAFAGSKTRMLADMVTGANRPFYRMGKPIFLGPVPRADFAEFLARGFAGAGIPVEAGAIDALLDAAEEVPYNVQLLAHACWTACMATIGTDGAGAARPLTAALVHEVRDREALRHDPFYTQLWTSLPSTQRRALVAVLRERGDGLSSTPVARRYGMPVTTLQRAIEALVAKQIVREDHARGGVRLRLEDPLFGAWIGLVVRE
ncbi:MAG TPA: ATP-binding protein [Gemmatimonadaceae bacterium]|nr:ATP-binding protein [Gemmatimonadaceae bacterium]